MSATGDAAIEVHELHKTYRDGLFGRRRIEALRGVSFQVPRGEIFGLLGPNGAGKTTVIKVLLGLVRGTSGSAALLGRPAGNRAGRRRVGYLPENHRLPRHHTPLSALDYYGSLSGLSRREVARRRGDLLATVGLDQWAATPVRKFSKGMQQRLGLALALLHEPELVILDEPTDGVDPVGRSEMRSLMQRLKAQGKTIFLNSHLLQELELVCDRVAILDRGRVLREGHMDELTFLAGQDVQLTLFGPEESVRAALAGHAADPPREAGDEQWDVILRAANQAAVDAAVDELRRRGVSIGAIVPTRQTLEEAFLAIVRQARGEP